MNYLAHGWRHLDRPYFVAGTAVPDWLSVADRRVRTRRAAAAEFLHDCDPLLAEVAAGIVQHHDDDDWFHRSRAFFELSLQFAARLREMFPEDDSFRSGFLGHILVELLMDATLTERYPTLPDRYYATVHRVNPTLLQAMVNRIAVRPTERLATMIQLFSSERFLCDYTDDQRLLRRLNQVMRRVQLPLIPDKLCAWLPVARGDVRDRADELLGLTGDGRET